MSDKLIHAEPNSPKRCQRIDRSTEDQCPYVSQPGESFCSKHMNGLQFQRRQQSLNNYKLAMFQADLDHQACRSDIGSLTEELILSRACTQTICNLCEQPGDLLIYTPQLSMLLDLTTELAITLHKIQVTTSTLLDKGVLFDLAESIINRLQAPEGPLDNEAALALTDKVMLTIGAKMGAGSRVPASNHSPSDTSNQLKPIHQVHYRIKHWDLFLKAYYENPALTNLKGELALARVILQNVLNTCTSAPTLLHNLGKVVKTLGSIRRIAHAIQLIDYQTGNLLDRSDVLQVATQLAALVAEVITPDEITVVVKDLEVIFAKHLSGGTTEVDRSHALQTGRRERDLAVA